MPMINSQSEISSQDLKRLYSAWAGIKTRCFNPKSPFFHLYGGKGVTICARWLEKGKGFQNFVEDMGVKPSPSHSLDRKDSDGDYEPLNCRWAKKITQSLNSTNKSPLGYGVRMFPNGRFNVRVAGKSIGCFSTLEEARAAYHVAACRVYGEDYLP